MKFAKHGIFAGSLLAAATFAPAQSYDVTVRTENPQNKPWVIVDAYPQETPQAAPKALLQRVPVIGRGADALGVYVSPVPPAMAAQLRLKQKTGLVVEGVVPGSPAERAGIQQYDVISSVDGQSVTNPQQVERSVSRHKEGEEVPVDLIREGKHLTLSLAVQRPTQSADSKSNDRQVSKDNQKQVDEMSERLKSEIEKQEKRIQELTEKIRAEAELAKKQIQDLKEQIRRDAQQQKEQMLKDSKNRNDNSDGDPKKPEKF